PGDPDERGADDAGVLVHDRLAGLGEERAGRGDDAVALPTVEPEAALLVEAAEVAHPVPDGGAKGDLGERGLVGTGEVRARDDRTPHADLAHLARRKDERVR